MNIQNYAWNVILLNCKRNLYDIDNGILYSYKL